MIKNVFGKLRQLFRPAVSRSEALAIARAQCTPNPAAFRIFGEAPATLRIYDKPTEPCWYIYAPWGDGKD